MDERISRSGRTKTSIWIDRELWFWFCGKDNPESYVKKHWTSSCELIEGFLYALQVTDKKLEQPILSPLPKVDVQLNLSREVARPRRRETLTGDQPLFQDWGTHLHCRFCKRKSKWLVYYVEGWDQIYRIYCCGYHVKPYRRMISKKKGYPQIDFQRLYKKEDENVQVEK